MIGEHGGRGEEGWGGTQTGWLFHKKLGPPAGIFSLFHLHSTFPLQPLNLSTCSQHTITPELLGSAAWERCEERQGHQQSPRTAQWRRASRELRREAKTSKFSLKILLLQEALHDVNLPK